jgi:hypothetical protein
MTDQLAMAKGASVSLTSDILNRTAREGASGVLTAYMDGGVEGLVESVKGASSSHTTLPQKAAAAALLCKSARLAPIVQKLAASEFVDIVPGLYATALAQGEEQMDKMAGLGALMHISFIRPSIIEKSASLSEPLLAQLHSVLAEQSPGEEVDDMVSPMAGEPEVDADIPSEDLGDLEEALTTDAAGSLVGEADGGEERDDEEIDGGAAGEDDLVDEFMQMDSEPALVAADKEDDARSALASR